MSFCFSIQIKSSHDATLDHAFRRTNRILRSEQEDLSLRRLSHLKRITSSDSEESEDVLETLDLVLDFGYHSYEAMCNATDPRDSVRGINHTSGRPTKTGGFREWMGIVGTAIFYIKVIHDGLKYWTSLYNIVTKICHI